MEVFSVCISSEQWYELESEWVGLGDDMCGDLGWTFLMRSGVQNASANLCGIKWFLTCGWNSCWDHGFIWSLT